MPELPEVETVVRGLRSVLVGQTIVKVHHRAPKTSLVVGPSFGNRSFQSVLGGRKALAAARRGKNILIALDENITLWVHLKMTGRFRTEEDGYAPLKHDLVKFRLSNGGSAKQPPVWLIFNDYRRFGRLRLFDNEELWRQDGLRKLGPEPLSVSSGAFIERCRRSDRMVKPALLDQTFLAGLGNIYADESLYAARIHPRRTTRSISRKKLADLHRHIRRLLKLAIRKMGTTVDTYSGVNGKPGTFQHCLKAYGRESCPCERCGRSLVREKIGSRSAVYCPRCQRL